MIFLNKSNQILLTMPILFHVSPFVNANHCSSVEKIAAPKRLNSTILNIFDKETVRGATHDICYVQVNKISYGNLNSTDSQQG